MPENRISWVEWLKKRHMLNDTQDTIVRTPDNDEWKKDSK